MTERRPYMKALEAVDPEFHRLLSSVMDTANGAGALDTKTKTLITLALDAAGGHRDGVRNLAQRARSLGATDAEIAETIRLAFVVAGLPGLLSGLVAFEGR